MTPTTFAFVAIAPLVPSSTETVTVPGGAGGVESANGERLRDPATAQFTVTDGSVLRLQQLLAQLGYLPLSFTPARPLAAPQEAAEAPAGHVQLALRRAGLARQLCGRRAPTTSSPRAPVMAYESNHNLTTDGLAGPQVWGELLADAAAGNVDPAPYNYVYVSKGSPETATVYSNGAVGLLDARQHRCCRGPDRLRGRSRSTLATGSPP